MKRNITQKLAILGCASSCLVNIAYANTTLGDESVVFVSPLPDFTNVACGADPRTYFYTVLNNSDTEIIEIEDFRIDIDQGDDFPEDEFIVEIDQSKVPLTKGALPCKTEMFLPVDKTCVIAVTVDPTDITCPSDHPFYNQRDIMRSLHIELDAGSQRELVAAIDLDVTILGTAQEYALLADLIDIDDDDGGGMKEDMGTNAGQVQVSQSVGYSTEILDEDDIIYHDDAELIAGLIDPETNQNTQNVAAFSDAEAAYEALRGAAYDESSTCDAQPLNLMGNVTVTPGFYCLIDHDGDNDYYVIDGLITFEGNSNSLFVFVMPSVRDDDINDPVLFEAETGASYRLFTVSGLVDPDNIFWVGADHIEFDVGTALAGTFITRGTIETDFDEVNTMISDPVGPAMVTGRLIGLQECGRESSMCARTEITLNGNTIVEP